jgi:hypothetical protein
MHLKFWLVSGALLFWMALFNLSAPASAQQSDRAFTLASSLLPDAPDPQTAAAQSKSSSQSQPVQSQSTQTGPAQKPDAGSTSSHKPLPQPKRILGVMPNYRAISAGTIPPPPTSREAFGIATENSFDYSAFVFVGITSLLAEGDEAHPQLGKGIPGYWAYYWRGWVDKTDGNYFVDWIMPTMLHQDERYYAMGQGGVVKRSVYAATRVFITPNYHGKNGFNTSEVLGRGITQAISLAYYPSQTQTASGYTSKFAYAIGRDALTNVFRELWPDISQRLFHRNH